MSIEDTDNLSSKVIYKDFSLNVHYLRVIKSVF